MTDEPCFHCSVVIEGAGIARVVTPATVVVPGPHQEEGRAEWAEERRTIRDQLQAASERHAALPAYARPTVTRPIRTSGPLDPDVHAALLRSAERGRAESIEAKVREDARAEWLNDEGLMPWDRP